MQCGFTYRLYCYDNIVSWFVKTMDYSKLVVVVSVLVPFFAQSFKEVLIKSDHSNCSHQAQLTASQRF